MFKYLVVLILCLNSYIFSEIFFVDPVKSVVSFEVNQFKFSKVKGFFKSYTIIMDFDKDTKNVKRIESKIDINSVYSGNSIRDRHLRSSKFFDILFFPDILCIVKVPFNLNNGKVPADIKIKDIEKNIDITFNYIESTENDVDYHIVDASFYLKRHDFNVDGYRLLVDNDVKVNLKLYFRSSND
ncbi:MAG: hypothetical protein CMP39_07920 [Rickettsiales bacterium]|nr:hypothetical protein [Rickettsiales bacterium]